MPYIPYANTYSKTIGPNGQFVANPRTDRQLYLPKHIVESQVTGTPFNPDHWWGYFVAVAKTPSAVLTDFTYIIDLSKLPSVFGTLVQDDAADIRITKLDGMQLPLDVINFQYNGGSPTGLVRTKWRGRMLPTRDQLVLVWVGYRRGTAVAYAASETYGSDNAYDANWEGYWADGCSQDRTAHAISFTVTGATAGDSTGKIGNATAYNGTKYASTTSATAVGLPATHDFSVLFWCNMSYASGDGGIVAWSGADDLIYYPEDNVAGSGGIRIFWRDVGLNIISEAGADGSGSWSHQALISRAADDHEVYRNSSSVATSVGSGTTGPFSEMGPNVYAGQRGVGLLQELQLHSTARSDEWISHEYDQTSDNAAFWGNWQFQQVAKGVTKRAPRNKRIATTPRKIIIPSFVEAGATGTPFHPSRWYGNLIAAAKPPTGVLTDFTYIIDLSKLPAAFGKMVQADGGDIRITTLDGRQLPFDLIDFQYNGGSATGLVRFKWIGRITPYLDALVRVWFGFDGDAVMYASDERYGSDNAYDANWLAYWPLHDLRDRTRNSYDLTEVGTMAGHTTGKLGDGYQTDGTDTEGLQNTSVPITGGSNLTILGWSSALNSTTEALIGSNASYEMVLRNDSGKPQFVLNSFSSNDRATGATTLTATWTHFGGRYDGTDLDVFLNGVSDGSVTPTGSYASFTGVCIGTFGLGTSPSGGAASIHDDVQIHTTGRSDEWIAHEYDQTSDNTSFWGSWRYERSDARQRSRIVVPSVPWVSGSTGRGSGSIDQRPNEFEVDYSHPLAKGLVFAGLGAYASDKYFHDSSVRRVSCDAFGFLQPARAIGRVGHQSAITVTDVHYASFPTITLQQSGRWTVSGWFNEYARDSYLRQFVGQQTANSTDRFVSYNGYLRLYDNAGGNTQSGYNDYFPLNQWQHICIRCNGAGSFNLELYQDGELKESLTDTGSYYEVSHLLGAELSATYRCFLGGVIDFMIHDRMLAGNEIAQLADPSNIMLSGMLRPIPSRSIFRGVALDPVEPKSGGVSAPAIHTASKSLTVRPNEFELDYSHPLAKGLVFAGLGGTRGNAVIDSSSQQLHSIGSDVAPTWSSVLRRHGMGFNGSSSELPLGNRPSISGTVSFSVSAWIFTSGTANCDVMCQRDFSDVNGQWRIQQNTSGTRFLFYTYNGGTVEQTLAIPTDTVYGSLGHFCAIRDQVGVHFYFNGKLINETLDSPLSMTSTITTNIGWNARDNNSWFAGQLYDVMIHERALTPAEISQLADPSNVMLSGLIRPIGRGQVPSRNTHKRYWVGRDPDWNQSRNWAAGPAQEGGAGVPTVNDGVVIE